MRSKVNVGNKNTAQMGCNLDTKWRILALIDWKLSVTVDAFDLDPFTAPGLRCFAHSQH